jgi:ABC-type nickel/cobalt efflux system permease component RcnA
MGGSSAKSRYYSLLLVREIRMLSVLLLGVLVGVQHAFEADHLAAMAALATRGRTVLETAKSGVVWGLGHALMLALFGGAALLADRSVPQPLARALEFAVGLMLIVLGAGVLRRLMRARLHFHVHAHGARKHFHAHSHVGHIDHAHDPHRHEHPRGFPVRALLVGMMHGMAGSAALIVLALGAVESLWQGFFFIVLFGFGSITGMAILGAVISVPLRYSAQGLTWVHNGLQGLVGSVTVGLGFHIVYEVGFAGGVI